jgi:ribosomal protein S18 acetylase RimI-like enzyme
MVAAVCAHHHALDPDRYDYLPDDVDRNARWLPQRAADPRSVLLIAADTDRAAPAGFLVATIEPNIPVYSTREFAFIHDLWVEPAHRSRGHGRALVTEALARFSVLGIAQIRLETAAANEPARRLFAACGFRPSSVEMIHTAPPQTHGTK